VMPAFAKIGWMVALILAAAFAGILILRPKLDLGSRVEGYCRKTCPADMNFTTYQDDRDQIYCVCHTKGTRLNRLISFSNKTEPPAEFWYNESGVW